MNDEAYKNKVIVSFCLSQKEYKEIPNLMTHDMYQMDNEKLQCKRVLGTAA